MIYSADTIKQQLLDQGITEVVFDGVTYSVVDTSALALQYILAYTEVTSSGAVITPNTRDYLYRMGQALQMFGDSSVVQSIQDLIDSNYDA